MFCLEDKTENIIEKILLEKKEIIDKTIEKYFPRKFSRKDLEFMCGSNILNIEASNEAIAKPMWELLDRGGKRWRPVLFLLIIEALGKDPEKFVDFCIIPEIIHNGTLIVDDVEDDSELRRGKPTIHKIFGEDIAINLGNAMYFLPLIIFIKKKNEIEKDRLIKAYETYIEEMIKLSFGQGNDIVWHRGIIKDEKIREEEYLQMCAYKTGTLARMSAKLAAILAEASDEIIEKIGRFAESIGIAFQIQDDILDVTAPESIGKTFGNDIKEGKRTLMVIYTLQKANEKDKKRLIEILNKHTDDIEERKEAIEILKKYNSIEYAKNVARKTVEDSWKEIEKIIPDNLAKEKLRLFAEYLIERNR